MNNLIRVIDAARRLGVTRQRVQQLVKAGRLDHVETPYGKLVRKDSLEALLTERELVRAARRSA